MALTKHCHHSNKNIFGYLYIPTLSELELKKFTESTEFHIDL